MGRKLPTLDRWQFKRAKAAFRSFAGADLLIDYPEWKAGLGLKADLLAKRIFALVDADGTGFIDFDEFLVFARHLYSESHRLEFIFRIYDLDGDGAIDKRELRAVLEASLAEQSVSLAEEVVKAMASHLLAKTDLDGDGRISSTEFVDVLGAYPGLQEQLDVYADDWLNEGQGFRPPRVPAAPFLVRLKRAWQNRARGWAWGALYAAANVVLFVLAAQRYAAKGAGPALQLARGAGACLNLNGGLILLPVCKSFWTWVRRTRGERLFPLDHGRIIHRLLGVALVVFSVVHVAGHMGDHWMTGRSALRTLAGTQVGITGVALLAVLALMSFTSRRSAAGRHESFAGTHLLYAPWLAGLLWHGPSFWMWLTPAALLFFLDALVRWAVKTRRVTVLEMKPLANGVTWLRFKKPAGFRFRPGDYLYLKVPAVSRTQWHPFTISAAPEAAHLGVHVRNSGDWTGALHNLSRKKWPVDKKWPAAVDGPYGAPSSRVGQARVAVLVAAGIGATPFASVLQSLLLRRKRGEEGVLEQTLYFHWLNRSQHSYEWFLDLLKEAERTLGAGRFLLHIHLTSLTHDMTNIAMQVAMDAYHDRHKRDPVTGLNTVTSAGRPDWDPLFRDLSLKHEGERVDVFFCGPTGLGKVVRRNCRKHGLIYHEEVF